MLPITDKTINLVDLAGLKLCNYTKNKIPIQSSRFERALIIASIVSLCIHARAPAEIYPEGAKLSRPRCVTVRSTRVF